MHFYIAELCIHIVRVVDKSEHVFRDEPVRFRKRLIHHRFNPCLRSFQLKLLRRFFRQLRAVLEQLRIPRNTE